MPEYFCISLIVHKNKQPQEMFKQPLLAQFNLKEGENTIKNSEYLLLAHRKVLLFFYEYEDADFNEFCINLSDVVFHTITFEKELADLTFFINDCFKASLTSSF